MLDSIFGPNGPTFFRTGYALTDLATGVTLARHGVLDFLERVSSTRRSGKRKAEKGLRGRGPFTVERGRQLGSPRKA